MITKEQYKELLKRPEWSYVRIAVLKRDQYKCTKCGKKDCRLNVHHKIYLQDKLPWEVPMKYLVSLCDYCHAKAHENRTISSFIKSSIPLRKSKKKNRRAKKSDTYVYRKAWSVDKKEWITLKVRVSK